MSFGLSIFGTVALMNKFNKVKSGDAIKLQMDILREKITNDAKRLAPVDTGALRASIDNEKIDDYSFKVFDQVDYGAHVEYGTFKMQAQPFLRPAVEMNVKMFLDKINWEMMARG